MSVVTLAHIDFWDVGQGDCTSLNFIDGSILLIDTGTRSSPIVDWLADRPRRIQSIVLTHNDADHSGALCSLVKQHGSRIGAIYMLEDRSRNAEAFQKLFRCALEGENAGFYRMQRLEAGKVIWADSSGLKLHAVHPGFSENVAAASANDSSAMLVLEHKGRWLAVWPGDLSLRTLARKAAGQNPEILMGPHHGAPMDYKRKPDAADHVAAVSPANAFISVGTRNGYSHPRGRYLLMLGKTRCRVRCSEVTRLCDPESARTGRPVFNGAAMLGLRAPRGGTACRGAWRVYVQNGQLSSDQFEQSHLERIAQLRRPQCLKAFGWRKGESLDSLPTGFS